MLTANHHNRMAVGCRGKGRSCWQLSSQRSSRCFSLVGGAPLMQRTPSRSPPLSPPCTSLPCDLFQASCLHQLVKIWSRLGVPVAQEVDHHAFLLGTWNCASVTHLVHHVPSCHAFADLHSRHCSQPTRTRLVFPCVVPDRSVRQS
jgi:hypothetical protein